MFVTQNRYANLIQDENQNQEVTPPTNSPTLNTELIDTDWYLPNHHLQSS